MTLTQTVKWFGEHWGAPICDPRHQIPVPVGATCTRCDAKFHSTSQGVGLPYIGVPPPSDLPELTVEWVQEVIFWHLDCWLESLGIGHRVKPTGN